MMRGQMPDNLAGQVNTISKNVTFRLLFFAAAVCIFITSVFAFLFMVLSLEWGPFTFLSVIFLLILAIVMLVLDAPMSNEKLDMVRVRVYKYLLFMTRFTGRGLWYAFLGTEVWVVLWDAEMGWLKWLAIPLGLYPVFLGIGTGLYGLKLSRQLNSVRRAIMDHPPPPQCNERGFDKSAFSDLCISANQTRFSDDELDYVINGLSFTPRNDGVVSQEEYYRWISAGWGQVV
mmetsp:Transcript_64546/g.120137  ORF Transcript_64546/g.120137 Transcript_64546/m.120137 type:complete len:231 (+) Transcript_64546:84-776(+)